MLQTFLPQKNFSQGALPSYDLDTMELLCYKGWNKASVTSSIKYSEKNCFHSSSFPFLFQSLKPNLTTLRLHLKEHLDIIYITFTQYCLQATLQNLGPEKIKNKKKRSFH